MSNESLADGLDNAALSLRREAEKYSDVSRKKAKLDWEAGQIMRAAAALRATEQPVTGPSGDPQKWIQALNDRIEELEQERDELKAQLAKSIKLGEKRTDRTLELPPEPEQEG